MTLNKLIYHFAQINKQEQLQNMKTEEKDIMAITMQPARHTSIVHSEEIKQSGNKIKDKCMFNKKKHIINKLQGRSLKTRETLSLLGYKYNDQVRCLYLHATKTSLVFRTH